MDDLATLLSQPALLQVTVRDEQGNPTGETISHRIHPLTFNDLAALQAWINAQFPEPYQSAWNAIQEAERSGKPFNVTQQQFILKNAAELATRPQHKLGTPDADQLLMSVEGFKQILMASIRKGEPSFDEAAAERLFKHMTQLDILKAYSDTQLNLVLSDPKATRLDVKTSGTPNGSTTSRRTRRAAQARARKTGGK